MEGGSVEGNGAGVVMTTDRCLLNPNRNPTLGRDEIEHYLREYLCAERVIWLTGEIPGDDTDSHIDQIARFVDADTVVLADLPGSDMFRENRQRLERWSRDAGRRLEILRLPVPTPRQVDGMWLPASYANFYLVNRAVLVPAFADEADEAAADLLAECFPDREAVLVPSDDLVFGLGALHCLSQQEPAAAEPYK
jgi:agmatine deiminase